MSKVIVKNNAKAFAAKAEAAARLATQRAANQIYTRSQNTVPVDTGTLKASAKVDPAKGAAGEYTAQVHYETLYALYVEMGTSKMSAQPYLVPAAKFTEQTFKADLRRVMGAL
ncbi:HK97 gp10 family phage protein [bacterium]|nr:HK97 gp10 family phage protein [bacterium]